MKEGILMMKFLKKSGEKNKKIHDIILKKYEEYKQHLDNKFISALEQDESFYQSIFELYFIDFLSDTSSYKYIMTHEDYGPDFRFMHPEGSFAIECVAPKNAENQHYKIPDIEKGQGCIVQRVEHDKLELRLANSFKNKQAQYQRWISKEVISPSLPLILAIGLNALPPAQVIVENTPEKIAKLLFSRDGSDIFYKDQDPKKGVATNFGKEYTMFSGFFICTEIIPSLAAWKKDISKLYFVPNPYAANKLPEAILKDFENEFNLLKTTEYMLECCVVD